MPELSHSFGGDLAAGATGDLVLIDGPERGRQRVLRRLLSNPGDYIFHPEYGAGLARFIGRPVSAGQLRAVVRSQIFKELSVAREPEPLVDVSARDDGKVFVSIRYADAESGATQLLSFPLGGQ